jgi:hypothetical protein
MVLQRVEVESFLDWVTALVGPIQFGSVNGSPEGLFHGAYMTTQDGWAKWAASWLEAGGNQASSRDAEELGLAARLHILNVAKDTKWPQPR